MHLNMEKVIFFKTCPLETRI